MLKRTHRLLQWLVLGTLVGLASGAGSALFLWLLDLATGFRGAHLWIVWLLPVAGLVMGAILQRWGGPVRAGSNLVIDTIHDDSPEIPLHVAPSILGGTVLTHLFGGSGGREGAAVQMGAALAEEISRRLHVRPATRKQLLSAGIAGGFGSVFGTPMAGTVFGMEMVHLGRIDYAAFIPSLTAAVVGDLTAQALGVKHEPFPAVPALGIDPLVLLKWVLVGVIVALVAAAFIETTHGIRRMLDSRLRSLPLQMALGGAAVVLMWQLLGSPDYLGLSLPLLSGAFADPAPWYSFALKAAFTAVTLGAGFLGGEVTPLFVVGATLGSALAGPLGLPVALTAGVCMAAMFAAASNTPLALSIMAVELLGAHALPHVVIVAVVAYLITGSRSIYPSQRLIREKGDTGSFEQPLTIRDMPHRTLLPFKQPERCADDDGTGTAP